MKRCLYAVMGALLITFLWSTALLAQEVPQCCKEQKACCQDGKACCPKQE